jgi:hypothetical protein
MEELVVRAQKDIFDRSLVEASGSLILRCECRQSSAGAALVRDVTSSLAD